MRDMEAATDRLRRAVERGERVAIFGDYDVDGACSAALLAEFLTACGCETIVHIPDRVTEGYGPNAEAMAGFAAKGARLVVTVDCGAVSHEPFAQAERLGLDVIVFDHHQAPEALPRALALVDPNRQDDLSGLGHLCGRRRRLYGPGGAQPGAPTGGILERARRPRPHRGARSGRARDRRRRRAADGTEPRLCRQGLERHAPAPASGTGGSVRRRRRGRTASALSSRLSHRPAHQRGRADRRRGAGRAPPDDAR